MLSYDHRIAADIFISHFDRPRPVDWAREYQDPAPVDVEIGFGYGEFLVDWAAAHPQRNYVGIEMDWGRITRTLSRISHLASQEKAFLREHARLLHIDAWVALQRLFAPRTIARVFCLFPCPWPKDSHERYRLFSREFLCLLNNRLADGGRVQCVTDSEAYADWISDRAGDTGFVFSRREIAPRFRTRFERKWQNSGQDKFHELVFQKQGHCPGNGEEDCNVKAYYHAEFNPEHFVLEKYVSPEMTVVEKEWFYDSSRQKAVVRVVVVEPHLTQHLWIGIIKTQKGWCVLRSEGQQVLPTPGVSRAIELVSQAVARTDRT